MSKIDFYVLRDRGELARQQFACKLAEKAYRLENSVHIQVADQASEKTLDELLWTFRDGSFVPHEVLASSGATAHVPVTIGYDKLPEKEPDLLINLGITIPDNAAAFPRVAEVVTSDDDSLAQSRQRFVQYRDKGHSLDTHKL
ncbi:MAG: DNA polymerase III subunit chi [Woeseiaceae bacterium]|jgi:DNA polymerase-3 subunit chi|nr:DNA polymerase III subunit chi [Woeseiaceae bacterium]|tara:strand:- start:91 stop:519 length:429 start_codon:yes stop_codon:yes gene_type:complete